MYLNPYVWGSPAGDPNGDWKAQERRRQRLQSAQVRQLMSPVSGFHQRRLNATLRRSARLNQPQVNLPKFDWSTIKGRRFLGPRVS